MRGPVRALAVSLLLVLSLPIAVAEPLASQPSLPVLLQLPADIGVHSDAGLISLWADRSVNKQSAERVRRFKESGGTFDFAAAAAAALACVAIDKAVSACREVKIVEADKKRTDAPILAALGEIPGGRALLISLIPEMTPPHLLLRAIASEVTVEKDAVARHRPMSAVVSRRAPAALAKDAKKNAAALEDFWFAGNSPHVVQVTREALEEMTALLGTVDAALDPEGNRPKSWSDLPKVKELEKAGRAKCNGSPCGGTRVLKDSGETIWLVLAPRLMSGGELPPEFGTAIGSFDREAAAFQTNLWVYVLLGIYI